MGKAIKYIMSFLPLPLSAMLAMLLIRRMDAVAGWAGNLLEIDSRLIGQVLQVLSQLRHAEITFAGLPVLLAGAAAGTVLFYLRSRAGFVLLWMAVLLALTAAGFWGAVVNGVQVGKLLSCLLPQLPNLI